MFLINSSTLSNHVDWAVLINYLLAASLPVKWTRSKLILHKGIDLPSLSLAFFLIATFFLSYILLTFLATQPFHDLQIHNHKRSTLQPIYVYFLEKTRPKFPESTFSNDFRSVSSSVTRWLLVACSVISRDSMLCGRTSISFRAL